MTGQDVNDIIIQFREEQDFSNVDLKLFEEMVRTVSTTSDQLASAIVPFLDRPAEQLDLIEKTILMMASHELQKAPHLHARVILDEAIDLAQRFGADQGHSFINAVLDKAARQWRGAELAGKVADDSGPSA
jgi:N utilization substance protein B